MPKHYDDESHMGDDTHSGKAHKGPKGKGKPKGKPAAKKAASKSGGASSWIAHVKKVAKAKGISYNKALKVASKTYKKK
mgnify:CR=1 FL=1